MQVNPVDAVRQLIALCEQVEAERDEARAERDAALASATPGRGHAKAPEGRPGTAGPWGVGRAGGGALTRKEAEALAQTCERLALENKRLRAENGNMFHLLEENKVLREEISRLRGPPLL